VKNFIQIEARNNYDDFQTLQFQNFHPKNCFNILKNWIILEFVNKAQQTFCRALDPHHLSVSPFEPSEFRVETFYWHCLPRQGYCV
jgi:hypothetical protein